MSVGEVCNREVVIVSRGKSLLAAAGLMRSHHVGDLVVVDEKAGARVPVGILTDRDLVLEALAEGVDSESVTVGDVMNSDLLLAQEGDDLLDTVREMRGRGVRRVPVVDVAGALVGILTLDDVVEIAAELLGNATALVRHEQEREQKLRD